MPGPTGIFVGLTQTELDDIREDAIARARTGDRTSISGGGKSGTKAFSMSASEVLREVVYAEQQSGTRAPRAQRVVQDMTGVYPFNP